MNRASGRASAIAVVLALAIGAGGCAIADADAAAGNDVGAAIPFEDLKQFGEFEVLDRDTAGFTEIVDSSQALGSARDADFGRPGVPEASLIRVVDSSDGLLPLAKGSLIWVFSWAGLHEDYYKAFPREDGKPNETVFVYTEYFVFVDAASGTPIAGVRH